MIKIAAAGDLHFDKESKNVLAKHFYQIEKFADILLLAGDLTQTGHPEEMSVLAEDLKKCPIPVVCVLGNHDYHSDSVQEVVNILKDAEVTVLENSSIILNIKNLTVGIAGTKGFGGGFIGSSGSEFGEPEMKSFIKHSKSISNQLGEIILNLKVDYKIVLLHYSPTKETLVGEKKEIYPFLGSYHLGEAIDYKNVDIVFHGHAHKGIEKGETPGKTPVRNVAQPVIRHPFNFYSLEKH